MWTRTAVSINTKFSPVYYHTHLYLHIIQYMLYKSLSPKGQSFYACLHYNLLFKKQWYSLVFVCHQKHLQYPTKSTLQSNWLFPGNLKYCVDPLLGFTFVFSFSNKIQHKIQPHLSVCTILIMPACFGVLRLILKPRGCLMKSRPSAFRAWSMLKKQMFMLTSAALQSMHAKQSCCMNIKKHLNK